MPIASWNLRPLSWEIAIMAKPLLTDELWVLIEPVLPRWVPSPKGGQLRLDDRKALTGILFVLLQALTKPRRLPSFPSSTRGFVRAC